eukprot:393962_1
MEDINEAVNMFDEDVMSLYYAVIVNVQKIESRLDAKINNQLPFVQKCQQEIAKKIDEMVVFVEDCLQNSTVLKLDIRNLNVLRLDYKVWREYHETPMKQFAQNMYQELTKLNPTLLNDDEKDEIIPLIQLE